MIEHTVDIRIDRPVEQVFAFLTDARNHSKWDTLSVAMEQQEPGPWRTGLKFREVRKLGGRDVEVYSQIASFTPNQRFDIQSVTGPPFQGHWVFEPENGGTHLRYTAQMQPTGFARLLEPLIAGQFRKQLNDNFARLKTVLESGT
jgi:uncharacterized membrane protein